MSKSLQRGNPRENVGPNKGPGFPPLDPIKEMGTESKKSFGALGSLPFGALNFPREKLPLNFQK